MASSPKSSARATRQAGQQTRASLLNAASKLFTEKGLAGVSMTEIATAADCFPSQVTYYFGDKDGLFVEVACRDALAVCSKVKRAASRSETADEAAHRIFNAAVCSQILSFAEALLLVRRRSDLQDTVAETFEALFEQTETTTATILRERGWTKGPVELQVRAFWSTVFGIALARAGTEKPRDSSHTQNPERATQALASVLGFIEVGEYPAPSSPGRSAQNA